MTVGYGTAEQVDGMAERSSDLYAVGGTLHRVLTHHDAVNNKPSIFSFPPIRSLRPDISPAFEQVVMKALSPTIEQRWATAADMERAVINLPPITTQPVVQPAGQGQFPQRQPSSGPNPPTPSNPMSQTPPSQVAIGTTGPAGTYISAALGHINAGRVEDAYLAIQQAFV